jgi:hypothetical protein
VSPQQRFYLVWQSCIGAAVANAVINGALGWAITRHMAQLPMWRIPGVAGDLAGTAFGVTFGTCVCMAVQVPWDLGRGKIAPLLVPLPGSIAALLARFPRGLIQRGIGLGALSVPLFALPVIAVLVACGAGAMDREPYVALKAALSAVEGAIVTPLIVLAALEDVARKRAAIA